MPCVCVVCAIGDCACGYPGGNGRNGGVGLGKVVGVRPVERRIDGPEVLARELVAIVDHAGTSRCCSNFGPGEVRTNATGPVCSIAGTGWPFASYLTNTLPP